MKRTQPNNILLGLISSGSFCDCTADLFTRSILNEYITVKNHAEELHGQSNTQAVDEFLKV